MHRDPASIFWVTLMGIGLTVCLGGVGVFAFGYHFWGWIAIGSGAGLGIFCLGALADLALEHRAPLRIPHRPQRSKPSPQAAPSKAAITYDIPPFRFIDTGNTYVYTNAPIAHVRCLIHSTPLLHKTRYETRELHNDDWVGSQREDVVWCENGKHRLSYPLTFEYTKFENVRTAAEAAIKGLQEQRGD